MIKKNKNPITRNLTLTRNQYQAIHRRLRDGCQKPQHPIRLQSGMSITLSVHTRKQKVLSLFTDQLTRNAKSIRSVR